MTLKLNMQEGILPLAPVQYLYIHDFLSNTEWLPHEYTFDYNTEKVNTYGGAKISLKEEILPQIYVDMLSLIKITKIFLTVVFGEAHHQQEPCISLGGIN